MRPTGTPGQGKKKTRKRPMTVADVSVDEVRGHEPSDLGVPKLNEARVPALQVMLNSLLSVHENRARAERGVTHAKHFESLLKTSTVKTHDVSLAESLCSAVKKAISAPPPMSPKAKSRNKAKPQAFSASTVDDSANTLVAFYRHIHANGLRVHEELALNLQVNVGDIIFLENSDELRAAAVAFRSAVRPPKDGDDLPPLAMLVVKLFCADDDELHERLGRTRELQLAQEQEAQRQRTQTAFEGSGADHSRRIALVDKLRSLLATSVSSSNPSSPQVWNLSNRLVTAHARHREEFALWVGTIAVLLSSLSWLARVGSTVPRPPINEANPVPSPPVSQKEKSKSKEPVDNSFTGPLDPDREAAVYAVHIIQFDDVKAAAACGAELDASIETGSRVEPPTFLCWKWVTFDELVQITASTLEAQSAVSSAGSSSQQGTNENEVPANIATTASRLTLVVKAKANQLISTSPLSPFPCDREVLLPSFHLLQKKFYKADARRLEFVLDDEPQHDLTLFFDTVLADARKADQVAATIHTRLVTQFISLHHCRRHPAQRLSHLCRTCDVLICLACTKEQHGHHDFVGRVAFCSEQRALCAPKRQLVQRRLECLRSLLSKLDQEEQSMHDLIDKTIADVSQRMVSRRESLLSDADERSKALLSQIEAEVQRCQADVDAIGKGRDHLRMMRRGRVEGMPTIKIHSASSIKDELDLKLPSKKVHQLVKLLTWSNPSQYLTQTVYPPQ